MTGLLEKALQWVETLSEEDQNAIAVQVLDSLDGEESWQRQFSERPELLKSLAHEAREEHRRGETRPLDETIG